MAPVTEARAAILVAHGSPAAPQGPQRAVVRLAADVAERLPGWSLRGATLATPAALANALAKLRGRRPVIFPLFMSDGWFVRVRLPELVAKACGDGFDMARPLGLDPALHRLCLDHALDAAAAAELPPTCTTLLLAAHGSPSDPRSREAVVEAVGTIASAGVFRAVRAGFLEEAPFLAEAARIEGPALCLPFFASRAGHVEKDVPRLLAKAGFKGPLLDAIGLHPGVPDIIAAALARQVLRCVA